MAANTDFLLNGGNEAPFFYRRVEAFTLTVVLWCQMTCLTLCRSLWDRFFSVG